MPNRRRRIQVHDFSGHPFQVDLSRELARRGFDVDHVFAAQYTSGKGKLQRELGDPDSLTFTPITVGAEFEKYSVAGRMRFEFAYANAWKQHTRATRPDCVIACNVPLFTLNHFRAWAGRQRQPWILWHQDIFSRAMGDELDRRFGTAAARVGGSYFTSRERKAVRSADRVIAIGAEFGRLYEDWGIDAANVSIIPNWAPIDDIKPTERDNSWALDHLENARAFRLLYAGTLGRKHNPMLLVDLLNGLRGANVDGGAELVVVSQGDGADDLSAVTRTETGADMTILPFQSAADLPEVLGAGDVLVAILEPEASTFSIPSKVLTYMAAGRPIVGLMPADNPAAADIRAAGGFVSTPDASGVRAAIGWLRTLASDPEQREQVGMRTRRLAEEKFGIEPITDQFVAVIDAALQRT